MAVTEHEQQRSVSNQVAGRISALATWFDPGEPHPYRGPFTLWPRATDGLLVVVVLAASLVTVAASAIVDGEDFTLDTITDRPAGAVILLAVAAASLWWRRAQPLGVTAVVLVVLILWAIVGYGDGQDLALVVAVYGVGRYCTDHNLNLATVVVAFIVSVGGSLIDASQRVDVFSAAVIVTALPWYVGRRVRNRGDYLALLQERAERLEADQLARARQAVVDERARIARELHDVVAHRVSMMTVQAGAAKTVAPHDLDGAVEAMGDVERAGRQALGELRHLLGVLRPRADEADDLGPQPGLAELPALVDQLISTGAEVSLTVAELPDHVPVAVDLSAYRIIQESFTNIIKHAGPNPTVAVSVTVDNSVLALDVINTTASAPSGLPPSGYGIAGMGERASLLGGTLTAEPEAPGRYRVRARLPLEPEPR